MSLCRSKVFGMRAAVMFCLLVMVASRSGPERSRVC